MGGDEEGELNTVSSSMDKIRIESITDVIYLEATSTAYEEVMCYT